MEIAAETAVRTIAGIAIISVGMSAVSTGHNIRIQVYTVKNEGVEIIKTDEYVMEREGTSPVELNTLRELDRKLARLSQMKRYRTP